MKGTIAFLMVTAGTLTAAIAVARTDTTVERWVATYQVDTLWAIVGLALIGIGIAVQRSGAAAAGQEARGGLAALDAALERIVDEVESLGQALASLDTDALHARVDSIVAGPVTEFAEGRQALAEVFGLAGYAGVMGPFSHGERYLNRAWSASADGYREEAEAYARRAGPLFREAADRRRELESSGTN
jgi:hypothetical protein